MIHGAQDNAMAEIALALAMAFFSLLVLSLVSMGGGEGARQETSRAATGIAFDAAAKVRPASDPKAPAGKAMVAKPERLLIFYGGRFLDADLNPTEPSRLGGSGPIVLAVDPALSMTQVLAAEAKVTGTDKIVTTLDERWLQALREKPK